MKHEGPAIETMLRRLVEMPPDFLEEPRLATGGHVHVAALVNDLLHRHGRRADPAALLRFDVRQPTIERNRLALAMIAVWLLADEWFVQAKIAHEALLSVLDGGVAEMAAVTAAHKFAADPERREELVRNVLARLGLRPAHETEQQATDRLSATSSIERRRLIEASRAAQERARAVREALVRKAAEESADKWTRE
jgi:hypothetical protein